MIETYYRPSTCRTHPGENHCRLDRPTPILCKGGYGLRSLHRNASKRQASSDATVSHLQLPALKLRIRMDRPLKPEQGHDSNSSCMNTADRTVDTDAWCGLEKPEPAVDIVHSISSTRGGPG